MSSLSRALESLRSSIATYYDAWATWRDTAANAHCAAVMGSSVTRHLRFSEEYTVADSINSDASHMYFRTGYHYNKEAVRDGFVQVKYVHTSWNFSDAMTKALGNSKLKCFKPYLKGHKPIPDCATLQAANANCNKD